MKALFQKREGVLNSYDLLKAAALLLMFVDHIGHFFYPDEMWFRVIGRLSVPIWFFLIGFADTRRVQGVIWIGAFAVLLSTIISGYYILPLNILFALAIARLVIDRIMIGGLRSYEGFAGLFFLLFFLTFPSLLLVEYGAMGVMFTVIGYLRRHKDGLAIKPIALFGFLFAVYAFYTVFSGVLLPSLSAEQMYVLSGGMAVLMVVFYVFGKIEFAGADKMMGALLWPIKFMGRHTLLIYAGHMIVLNLVMLWIGDDRYGFGQVQIMPTRFIEILKAVLG